VPDDVVAAVDANAQRAGLTRAESTRNGVDQRVTLGEPPVSIMTVEHLTPAIEARAVVVQLLLADRGQHRAPSIPDLLIAATAEISRLTVLHIDKDFDLIAAITDHSIERLEM
jgi:predicted nucleic acid-binding protein